MGKRAERGREIVHTARAMQFWKNQSGDCSVCFIKSKHIINRNWYAFQEYKQ